MNPAFQVNHFHGTFVFIFNHPMLVALDEQIQTEPGDEISIKEFKQVVSRLKVNYQDANGRPVMRSYKFNNAIILHTNTDVAINLKDKLASFKELPQHLFAFREKLNDRLQKVQRHNQLFAEAA